MKKLLTGMLMTLTIAVALAPTARAAEIPPTAECIALAEKQAKEYKAEMAKNPSWRKVQKLNKKQIREMGANDCVSDPEPLLKPGMKTKPLTEQCVTAAKAAGELWAPATKKLTALERSHTPQARKIRQRFRKVQKRVRKLKAQGASRSRIKPVVRQRARIGRQIGRLNKSFMKKATKIVAPDATANGLVVAELVSLRCTDLTALFGERPNGPVDRQIAKNQMLIFMTFFYSLVKQENSSSGEAGTSVVGLVPLLSKAEVPTEGLPTP